MKQACSASSAALHAQFQVGTLGKWAGVWRWDQGSSSRRCRWVVWAVRACLDGATGSDGGGLDALGYRGGSVPLMPDNQDRLRKTNSGGAGKPGARAKRWPFVHQQLSRQLSNLDILIGVRRLLLERQVAW